MRPIIAQCGSLTYDRSVWKHRIANVGAGATISSTTRTSAPGWMFPDSGNPSPVATQSGGTRRFDVGSPAPALVRDEKGYEALFFLGAQFLALAPAVHTIPSVHLGGLWQLRTRWPAASKVCRRGVVRAGEE